MYQDIITERRVRRRLAQWYGPRQVEQVEALDGWSYRARLAGGGIALVTVAEDGSITIEEPEVVC